MLPVMFIPIDPSDSNEAMYLLSFFDNFIILNILYALIVILFVGLCAGDLPLQGPGPPDQQGEHEAQQVPDQCLRCVPASVITCRGPKISSAPRSWIFLYLC